MSPLKSILVAVAIAIVGTLQGCSSTDDTLIVTECDANTTAVGCVGEASNASLTDACERARVLLDCVSTALCCPILSDMTAEWLASGIAEVSDCNVTDPCA
eukprot:Skav206326  [mRNA]  locus=scaffold1420:191293:191595:- [translate_table: standard]